MSKAASGRGDGAEELSFQIDGRSRDLLRRFMEESDRRHDSMTQVSDDIELNLGLSLGGRFGTDPKDKRLLRSSSIIGLEMMPRDVDLAPPAAALPLIRTCSLPTETEEEWRKRKELQSLRRMEAKRKRSEKQRSYRGPFKDGASLERELEEEKQRDEEALSALSLKGKVLGSNVVPNGFSLPPVGLPAWAGRGTDTAKSRGSQGSGSSGGGGGSDMDSRSFQGSSNCMEAKSPASIQSLPDHIEQKVVITTATPQQATEEKPLINPVVGRLAAGNANKKAQMENGVREMERNVMDEMPCVSTKGDGPNGRRIEGFLYEYRKGEEVRIVCVCHGSFLSPAEFVRHAGGGDVAHPLKHIVVNPTPSSFL